MPEETQPAAFDEVELTPEQQARKDALQQTADVAAAHPANQIPNSGGAPAPSGFKIDDFEKFAALFKRKRELDAELKSVKDEIAGMQEQLQEQLLASGMPQIKLNNGALVSQKSDVTVKAGKPGESATEEDWNAACDVLEKIGMADYSKRRFLLPSLKSYITGLRKEADAEGREYESVMELLPPELAEVISADVKVTLTAKGG